MQKRKILIADDEEYLHVMYGKFLSDDYDVLHAYDGAETLMLAVDEQPNIILLDIKIPVINGQAVCRKIKQSPEIQDIKIIIMSNGDQEQYSNLIDLEMGADDYMLKPCSCDYLKSKVRDILHKSWEDIQLQSAR